MFPSNSAKPSIIVRFGVLLALVTFASLESNPLVRFEATVGLSHAPLERFLGIKNFFSGMTEGVHRLAVLDFKGSVAANVFAPGLSFFIVASILTWSVPRADSRRKEFAFFAVFLVLSLLVNIFHG